MIDSTAASDRRARAGRLARFAAPIALMALIWALSDQEQVGPDLGAWARLATSAVHFTEFALLFTLWRWALGPRRAPAAAAIALAWAVLDEVHQSWVPGRDSDPIDVLVDAAGIAAAWLLLARLRRRADGRAG